MAKQLNVALNFTANTNQAKNQISELNSLLNQVGYGSNFKVDSNSIKEAQKAAKDLAYHLNKAYNPETGKLNLNDFNKSLKESGTNVTALSSKLLTAGTTGQQAFVSLSKAIANAEQPIIRVNGLLSEMWTTMKNTARWQITSSALHGLIGGLHSAVGYAKDLNKTLTDIRIVAPEKSIEDMAKFAELANKQAKELSSTTLDYAKGALIYYQQGLDDTQTKERTDVTTKMANVTGDKVDEVSSYMTSIWNNFNAAGDESAEHFADILTKLGAETAASTTEITDALSKYTGVANTIGLSYESATAAATTLIDRMRETPEVAGTALKTVFARMEGLKIDNKIEAGADGPATTLNKYSEALAAIGVQIKDQNGEMRQADDILMDMGERWQGLAQDQKIAVAETVAGIRQWQQFSALMENFDYFKQYKEMAETGSEGALQEQQEIYAESWEAASNRVKSSIQSIYMELLDDKAFIKITNTIADLVSGLDNFIERIGGLKGVLVGLGAFILAGISKKIQPAIQGLAANVSIAMGGAQKQYSKINAETAKQISEVQDNKNLTAVQKQELINSKQVLNFKSKLALVEKDLSTLERDRLNNSLENLQKEQEFLTDIVAKTQQLKEENKDLLAGNFNSSSKTLDRLSEKMLKPLDKKLESGELTDKQWNDIFRQQEQIIGTTDQARLNSGDAIQKIGAQMVKNFSTGKNESAFGGTVFSGTIDSLKGLQQEISALPQGIKLTDDRIKNIQQRFRLLMEEIGPCINETKEFKDALYQIQHPKGLDDLQNGFRKIIQEISLTTISANDFKKILTTLGVPAQELRQFEEILEQVKNKEIEVAEGTERMAQAFLNLEEQTKHTVTGIEAISSAAAGLGQLAMAMMSIRSIFDALSNPDMSGWEKFTTILMSVSMLVPAVIGSMSSLTTVMGFLTKENVALFVSEELAAKGTKSLSWALKELWTKSLLPLLANPITWVFLALAAAIGVAVVATKNLYDKAHTARTALKEYNDGVEDSRNATNELINQVNGLGDAFDNLSSKRDSLKDLTQGTAEWHKALNELNKDTIDTVNQFNELNDTLGDTEKLKELGLSDLEFGKDFNYDSEGALQLSDEVKTKMLKVESAVISEATIENARDKLQESQLELDAAREEIIEGSFGQGKQFDHSKEYLEKHPQTQYQENALVNPWMTSYVSQMQDEAKSVYLGYSNNIEEKTYDILQELVEKGQLSAEKLEDKEQIQAILEAAGLQSEQAAEQADLVANNAKELSQAIVDNTLAVKANSEQYQAALQNDILNNQTNPFHDTVQSLEKKDRTGGANYLSRAWQQQTTTYEDMSEKQLEKNGWFDKYAQSKQFTKDDSVESGYVDAKGEEVQVTKELVDQYRKEQEALEVLKDQQDDLAIKMVDTIEDTKKDNAALKDATKVWKEYKNAIKDASDALKAGDKIQQKTKNQLNELAKKILPNLVEALDIDDDDLGILNGEFLAENADLVEDALDGDVNAIQQLQKAYSKAAIEVDDVKKSLSDIQFDSSGLETAYSEIKDFLENDKIEDIPIGIDFEYGDNLNDAQSQILKVFTELIDTGQYTAEEVSDMMGGMFDVEVDGYDLIPMNTSQSLATADQFKETHHIEMPVTDISGDGIGYHIDSDDMDEQTWADTKADWASKGFIAKPHIKGARTTNTPAPPKNPNVGSPKSGAKNGGNRGGRGRSRRRERVRKAKKEDEKSVIVKRYKEITDQLDRNTKEYERLNKVQDKLYGKARLNQMDQVNKKHLEEIKLLQKKSKEARQYYLNDRRDAKEALKEVLKASSTAQTKNKYQRLTSEQIAALNAIEDLDFNENGEITNYTVIMKALQDQLNAYERVYNSGSQTFGNEESQSEYKEKIIDPLKEKIDKLQEAIDQYDETRELMEELKDQIDDAYTEWQTANYEKLQYALELKVTINDNDLKQIDYYFNKLSDDVYKAAEAFDMYFTEVGVYTPDGVKKVEEVTDVLQEQLDKLKEKREALLQEAADAKKALEEAAAVYSTSSEVTGTKEKGIYTSYTGFSYGNWLDAKKQYEKAQKLLKIGKIKKSNFDKIEERFKQQDEKKQAYEDALKRYKDAVKQGGISAQQARQELAKISLTDIEKENLDKKLTDAKKGYTSASDTKKYKKAKAKYQKALKEWKSKRKGKKKLSGKYYDNLVKAYEEFQKVKENWNAEYNEDKLKKAKKLWKTKGKGKKKGRYWEAYKKQLEAKQAYEKSIMEYSTKYSEEIFNSVQSAYDAAVAKLNKINKKKKKKAYKKQKAKVDELKALLDKQKELKEEYELWTEALANAEAAELAIKEANDALEKRKQELYPGNDNETVNEYTMLTVVGGKVGSITRAIYDQISAYVDLEQQYKNTEISQQEYIDGMQSAYDSILDQLSSLQDLKSEMEDYYGNTLSNAVAELEKFNTKLSYQTDLISNLQTLAELSNRYDKNYDLQEKFAESRMLLSKGQYEIYKNDYVAFQSEFEYAEELKQAIQKEIDDLKSNSTGYMQDEKTRVVAEIADAEKRLEEAKAHGNSSEIKRAEEALNTLKAKQQALESMNTESLQTTLEEQYKIYKDMSEAAYEAAQNAYSNMFSSLEEAMQANADLLETSLNRAADAMEKALTRIAGGFEEIQRQMGLTSTNQEEYLTKTNQNYELNKMQRTLQKDIDKTNNKQAKLRLANFSKELKQMQEKDKLSNLELEIAQKKYDLLKAQIELEDSQNAKQIIRLSRDAEGNYGYVYVANQDEIEDAAQAVEDANNELYNLQLEATNNYGQKYIQTAQEMQEALKEAYQISDEEERNARIEAIKKQYGDLLETYENLYKIGYSATDYLEDALMADSWVYDNYNGIITNVSSNLSAFDIYIEDANRALETFNGITNQLLGTEWNQLTTTLLEDTEKLVNETLQDYQNALSDINSVLDSVHEKLHNFAENLLPVLNDQIQETETLLKQLNDTIRYQAQNDTSQDGYANFNRFFQQRAGDRSTYSYKMGQSGYGMFYNISGEVGASAAIANKWTADVMKYNEEKAKQLVNRNDYTGGFYGFTNEGKFEYILNAAKDSEEYKKWIQDNGIVESTIAALASGGYTGDWLGEAADGKLAVLHEKELVLNASDTQNILAVVDGVREMAAAGFLSNLQSVGINSAAFGTQAVEQQVHIDAQFPSVTDRYEIEQAFSNLVNKAAQYVNNTRR